MSQADLLVELGTEELPPKALGKLCDAFANNFSQQLDEAGFEHGNIVTFATPRRLAFRVNALILQQPDRQIEKRGPAIQAAFDDAGNPTRAATGFAKSVGTDVDKLERLSTSKGEWLMARITEKGKALSDVAQPFLEKAIHDLPIPKRMRWGASRVQFVRPVHWLVAMIDDQVLPLELLGLASDRLTYGHRFHHPDALSIPSASQYEQLLIEKGQVQPDFSQRRQLIAEQAKQLGEKAGGQTHIDTDLLDEVTALVEWPCPLAGQFEDRYLRVPQEALISTMESDQKYFPVLDTQGQLLNTFVFVSNIDSSDPAKVIAGNEKVVRPRLADAEFFYDSDLKKTLAQHAEPLDRVVFQQQLGTLADKCHRMASLAMSISEQLGGDPQLAQKAATLAKADLTSGMVGEFDRMQGIMGRYLARHEGLDGELADALEEQYLPRFSGDQLPKTITGQALALADRLDTLTGIFGIGAKPSGTKDPFALRRASLGILRIIIEGQLPLNLTPLINQAIEQLQDRIDPEQGRDALGFLLGRYRSFYQDRGFSVPLIQAVEAVAPDQPADLDRRLHALADFQQAPDCAALAAANKRVANILTKQGFNHAAAAPPDRAHLTEPAEIALAKALDEQASMQTDAYPARLASLASLRTPVDNFFDEVRVVVDDDKIRDNRLRLLAKLRNLFLRIADISLLD